MGDWRGGWDGGKAWDLAIAAVRLGTGEGGGENQHSLEQGSAYFCSESDSDLEQRHIAHGMGG